MYLEPTERVCSGYKCRSSPLERATENTPPQNHSNPLAGFEGQLRHGGNGRKGGKGRERKRRKEREKTPFEINFWLRPRTNGKQTHTSRVVKTFISRQSQSPRAADRRQRQDQDSWMRREQTEARQSFQSGNSQISMLAEKL